MSNCDSLVEWSFIRSWVYVKDTRNKQKILCSVSSSCVFVYLSVIAEGGLFKMHSQSGRAAWFTSQSRGSNSREARGGNDRVLVVHLWPAVMDLTDGRVLCSWRRWAWQEQSVRDVHSSAVLTRAYYMLWKCGSVCMLGDTTTVHRPKACYDAVNIESCVGGFVSFSVRTGFCKTSSSSSKHTHTWAVLFHLLVYDCITHVKWNTIWCVAEYWWGVDMYSACEKLGKCMIFHV